jgi:TolB-like protein
MVVRKLSFVRTGVLSKGRSPAAAVALTGLLLLVTVPGLFGQGIERGSGGSVDRAERITVVPFVNTTDVDQWDNLAAAMSSAVRLTIQLGARYDVVTPDLDGVDPFGPDGPLQLRRIAEESRIDAAVLGRISALENGRIELETSVWSAATGQIIGSERREAFGSFDILDAADELVILTSSALLGYRIDFGAVVLQPSRDDVEYRVSIDGVPIGSNLRTIPQVLVGQRRFEITVSIGGRPQLAYSADRLIRPGEAIELAFGLPRVTRREQDEVRVRQELARNLLGQPESFQVAFDALSESRSLLSRSSSAGALEPLTREQELLEKLWLLDEEYLQLAREDRGALGEILTGTDRIAVSGETDSETVARVTRNGAALYYLMRLYWAESLGTARWDDAEALLGEMGAVVDTYGLDEIRPRLAADARAFAGAREEAAAVQTRRRRPWPYLGLAVGLGGVGYGGYLYGTDAVGKLTDEGDESFLQYQNATDPVEIERLRGETEDLYDEAELTEWIQWGSIAAGGVAAVVSTIFLVRNQRAGEAFLRDWARDRYGREIDAAGEIIELLRNGEEETGGSSIVVLGPTDALVDIDGSPRALPLVVRQRVGLPLTVSGGVPYVDRERSRLFGAGPALTVLR